MTTTQPAPPPRASILVPVFSGSQVRSGAAVLRALARSRDADLVLLDLAQPALGRTVDADAEDAAQGQRMRALSEALAGPGVTIRSDRRIGHNLQGTIREAVADLEPDLLVLTWRPQRSRSLLRDELALHDLLIDVPCDLAVLGTQEDAPPPRRVLLAATNGTEVALARNLAVGIATDGGGTITFLASGDGGEDAAREQLEARVAELADPSRGSTRLAPALRSEAAAILQVASPDEFDLLVIGTPDFGVIHRLALGSVAERVARRAALPVLVVKPRPSPAQTAVRRIADAVLAVLPTSSEQAKVDTYRAVRAASRGNVDFNVMIALAAAIAALGELLNSPAVVIGGMLVAPLMSPVIGLGLAIVHGDARLLRLSAASVLRGSLTAVAVGVAIGLVIPGASITSEITARTSPTLLDLGVAIAAGGAGAFAMNRERLSASLPGVAIAVALVPPLAAVGIGIALRDPAAGGGAALLFVANLVAIAAASGFVFLLVGFRPEPEHAPRLRVFSRGFTALALLVIAVSIPLAWLTANSVRDAHTNRDVRAAVAAGIAPLPGVRSTGYQLARESGTLHVTVDLETPIAITADQSQGIERRMEASMGRPLDITLRLIQVTEVNGNGEPVGAGASASPTPPAR